MITSFLLLAVRIGLDSWSLRMKCEAVTNLELTARYRNAYDVVFGSFVVIQSLPWGRRRTIFVMTKCVLSEKIAFLVKVVGFDKMRDSSFHVDVYFWA